uniref:Protein FAM91A1 n=1 Tax=Xenopsylla cheopis TaxID=163159 RepID=A0A6M2DPN4_XENCH
MSNDIENNICKNIPWSQLPSHLKQLLNSQKEYEKHILNISLKKQLRYRGNLVRQIFRDEEKYYELLVRFSMECLMLYPYHLADIIVKGLRVTPFNYYIDMLEELMKQERSYDTLPNFTAADCLRLIGVGRNEYIELMNQSRGLRGKLFRKPQLLSLLPRLPIDVHMEPWWRLDIGYVLENDIKFVSDAEKDLIDKLIDHGSQTLGELDHKIVSSLYKRGLVYLDVPITGADYVSVPPLQGFVMNRLTGDYFESLLYKIFVSIDEHTSISELASMLQIELDSVKQAVSLYCRLGFAHKKFDNVEMNINKLHPSWLNRANPVRQSPVTPLTFDSALTPPISPVPIPHCTVQSQSNTSPKTPNDSGARCGPRIGFLFDSALTAFLMMGNLSPGLKNHAVTMFEVGKLCDESLDSFLAELDKVSLLDSDGEGDASRFFAHAVHLRSTILRLRLLSPYGMDLLRQESLQALDRGTCERLLQHKYRLLLSMAPLGREGSLVSPIEPPHLGPATPEVNSLWFKLYIYHMSGYGPPSLLLTKGTRLKQMPRLFLGYSKLLVTSWLHEPAIISATSLLSINESLKYTPVIVQAYGTMSTANTKIVAFPFNTTKSGNEIQWHNHPAITNLSKYIDLENTCGYITFVNTGVIDIGCENHDPIVRLGKTTKNLDKNSGIDSSATDCKTTISNENFNFEKVDVNPVSQESEKSIQNHVPTLNTSDKFSPADELQSPNESHFSITPVKTVSESSPSNCFTSSDCDDILREELDNLEISNNTKCETNKCEKKINNILTSDDLMSPLDENISMFSIVGESECNDSSEQVTEEAIDNKIDSKNNNEEEWTLLECCFGIPLFDADANTHICDAIVQHLQNPENLPRIVQANKKLGDHLLQFISQCQYYPGENMGIIKRGFLAPLPKKCLAFENGKVNVWLGK